MSFLAALIWFLAGACVASMIRVGLALERIGERLMQEPSGRVTEEPPEPQASNDSRRPDWQGPGEPKRCRCPRCKRSERRR